MKEVVAYVASRHGCSERRACSLTRQHRSTQRKPSTRDPRLEIRQRMREIAATRIRYVAGLRPITGWLSADQPYGISGSAR